MAGILALFFAVAGCSREDGCEIRTAADLKGRHVAHMSSDFHKRELVALQPDIVFDPYSEYSFAFESLRKGKIAAVSIGDTYADVWTAKYPGEFRVMFAYADDVCCFLLPKNSPLKPKLDAELRKMGAEGTLDAVYHKWVEAAKAGNSLELPRQTAPSGAKELGVACAAISEPWCMVANGEVVGIDMEILTLAANRLGLRLKPKAYSWGGMVDCVNGGRCDVACGGVYTAGGVFPTVDVSEKYADVKMCILVRNEAFGGGAPGLTAFAKSMKASFVRTFVTEDRWKMLADGFVVTLLITFLSALLGTALAFPVWLARTSRVRPIAFCAKAYIAILQGTPVLVLLMVLFYVVFGKADVDALWVAVVGFGLNLSAYAGEMLRSGVDSVPRGQVEAALALGYTPRLAFFRFVLPQAVRTVLPVYRGELIGLLKMTSIVGYIAIGDLTKASDLVRSRTYESFFPIITTAFVYFAASWLLAFAFERFGRRLDPAFGRGRKGGAA
ncbi:MAG: ABC transporter substrate-binding protein/permease [Kiritimatiellae bacterium]|nr:ABC transporter substrate-binding protein/permease [Kiritimatiellia bacterium]